MTVDSLDQKLIDLLSSDADRSSEVLSKCLWASSSTVRRRTRRLIQQGMVRIVGLPEPTRIGFTLRAVLVFSVAHDKLNLVMETLSNHPAVKWLSATSGRFDVVALVWFASSEDLFSFMEREIGQLEGISHAETLICLHVEKCAGVRV